MNCPRCGLQTLPDQKFCRSCGDRLQIITQPIVEHAAVARLEQTPVIIFKDEPQRANSLSVWGFMIMFIGVAMGVIGKMLLHEELVTVVGVLVSLLGMFLTVCPYLLPSPRRKYDSIASAQPEALTQSHPTRYLPPESTIEYAPSISERTTDLLTNSAATRPGQREDGEAEA
jgi:hypothetical protein